MASPGTSAVLGNWDYWYVGINTDGTYKIYNYYNKQALDTASDFATPIVLLTSGSTGEGWLITQNSDGTYTLYNNGIKKYLGLQDGGYPQYGVSGYTHWSIIPAVTTALVTVTNTITITSTNGPVTSYVLGADVTSLATAIITTTVVGLLIFYNRYPTYSGVPRGFKGLEITFAITDIHTKCKTRSKPITRHAKEVGQALGEVYRYCHYD
jgi:hypothetical protein